MLAFPISVSLRLATLHSGTCFLCLALLAYVACLVPWCIVDVRVDSLFGPVVELSSEPPHTSSFHGVNIGGWLLLERWMGPGEAFKGVPESFQSEWDLCHYLGVLECTKRLQKHRSTTMSKSYLEAVKRAGFNSIRVPFGYWLIEPLPGDGFVMGDGTKHLDDIVDWAAEMNLTVVLDLHGSPGGQSGWHHCGRANKGWTPSLLNTDHAVRVLDQVAQRYGNRVFAIQVINEPSWDLEAHVLLEYFHRTYQAIRANTESCVVVFAIHPAERHVDFPDHSFDGMQHIAIDVHFYAVFDFWWKSLSMVNLLRSARSSREYDIRVIENRLAPVLVGEWSAQMPWRSSPAPYPSRRDMVRAEPDASRATLRAQRFFVCTQLHLLRSASVGGYFWTFRTNRNTGLWDAEVAMKRDSFNSSWRFDRCGVSVPNSKMDGALLVTFIFALPCCVVAAAAIRWRLCFRDVNAFSARNWCLKVRLAMNQCWSFLSMFVRLTDLGVPWMVLPLAPPDAEADLISSEVEFTFSGWWRLLVCIGILRIGLIIVLICAPVKYAGSKAFWLRCLPTRMPEQQRLLLVVSLVGELSEVQDGGGKPVARRSLQWLAVLGTLLINLLEGSALCVLASSDWAAGAALWWLASILVVCNTLLTLRELCFLSGSVCRLDGRGHVRMALRLLCLSAYRLLAAFVCLVFTVGAFLVVTLACSHTTPHARHILARIVIALDTWSRQTFRLDFPH